MLLLLNVYKSKQLHIILLNWSMEQASDFYCLRCDIYYVVNDKLRRNQEMWAINRAVKR
jgi:hypothetical protein